MLAILHTILHFCITLHRHLTFCWPQSNYCETVALLEHLNIWGVKEFLWLCLHFIIFNFLAFRNLFGLPFSASMLWTVWKWFTHILTTRISWTGWKSMTLLLSSWELRLLGKLQYWYAKSGMTGILVFQRNTAKICLPGTETAGNTKC